MRTNSPVFFLLLLFFSFNTHLCFAADTLSAGQSLYPNQTLVSAEGNFELGLFKPGTSSKYYFAMWYKKISVQNKTVVWVANRDDPFTDPSSSELKLLEDGNLVILNNQSNIPIWSTGSILDVMNSSELVLQDDGNLVLRGGSNPSVVLWQSFDHPTDTWLPGGKLRFDNRTKLSTPLSSWNNSENPGQGMFSLRLDPIEKEYSIRWNNSTRYWNSGPWDGRGFSLVPEMRENSIFNVSYISNENESYFTFDVYNTSMMSRLVMGLSGQVNQFIWYENTQSWGSIWTAPSQQCEVYMFCGAFSTCNQRGLPICECLPGFQPRFSSNWNLSDSSGGCVRKATLQCGDRDGFWLMENMKLPESGEAFLAENDQECRMNCLKKCSCNAYAYDNSTGTTGNCFSWNIDLLNMQVSDTNDSSRRDLYLRLAASEVQSLRKMRKESDERRNSGKGDADQNRNSPVETANHKGKTVIIIVVTVSAGVLVVGVLMYISWQCRTKRKERQKKKDMESLVVGRSNGSSESPDTSKGADDSELSVFNFEKLAIATNYFDLAHKLGEGGFGPVYKGKLSDGQEIAVKRLSKGSGQGLEEFKNEVVVISRLQHRNLVRLLGCCIQGDEKMLIYEYMPNKSLDSFIFDSAKQSVLDWTKRFQIIMGICRGILYLHRDSRLRVIHRDLKASNILLDRDLKPKISDFGMARIFGGDELQAKTSRVVGTYGYMSPEYAMKGVFSEKSDVYSFGVLLLELVSGKRNTLSDREQVWSLLGYAWILWSEGKTQELIHPAMLGSNNQEEIERCVHVGLLCVQDFPEDRPAMPSIISMLTSETPILDLPERPVYTGREVAPDFDLSLENRKMWSRNNVLFTTMEGR